MIRVALTGGIATGKSYCLRRFEALGAAVADADRLARDAVAPGSAGLRAVVDRFGTGVLASDGSLDRATLGRIVFADPKARAALESIVHPEVYRRIRQWFANLPSATAIAMADIPLVFETGHNHDFDRIVVAACSAHEQVRRIVERDGLSTDDARARLAAQWPIEEKVRRAWRVIWTDRSLEDTGRQVEAVYRELLTSDVRS